MSAYAKKDNFWSKQRVEKGMTLREIAELLGSDEKRVGAYFSGFIMPSKQTIKELCDLFGVDFKKGDLEFQHAHRQWKAEHGKKVSYSASPRRKKDIENAEDVLESLYGNLSCKEFLDIYNAMIGNADDTVNPLAILYHKVDDYETYRKIIKIIKGEDILC